MTSLSKYLKDNIKISLAEYLEKDNAESEPVDVIVDSFIVDASVYSQLEDKQGFIVEAKTCFTPIPGVKKYSYRFDKVFGEQRPGNMRHVHIFYDGDELFAINVDGTAHDGYHQVHIPNDVIPFLQKKGVTIPKDNIIECITLSSNSGLLLEAHNRRQSANNSVESEILDNALQIGKIIRNSRTFQLVISNADETLLRLHPKVRFSNLTKLNVSSIEMSEFMNLLIQTLDDYPHFNSNPIEIFDDTATPKRIYVNWE